MSQIFDEVPDERTAEPESADTATGSRPPAPMGRAGRIVKRVLGAIGITVLALLFLGLLLYRFGSMWTPSAEVRQAYADEVAAGTAPAIEQSFHIPIPGCVCHSPDPALQMQHESRHIRDCTSCH